MIAEVAKAVPVLSADPASPDDGGTMTMTMTKQPFSLTLDDADDDSAGRSGSDSEPKVDSGVDCGADPETPDEETCAEILRTIEYYLSDENVLRDPFLLKHVRRNKEGYVSVKLLASFRKVRGMCRSWEHVAHSVRPSKLLELNADGTKVRRLNPLPPVDDSAASALSRSVLAHGFLDSPGVESVSEKLSRCGEIALVRILRPGAGSAPAEVRRLVAKNAEMQAQVCALVEFEELAGAKAAVETEHEGFRVTPLVPVDALVDTSKPPQDSPKKKKKRCKRNSKGSTDLLSDLGYQNRRGSSGSLSSSSGSLSTSPAGGFFENRFPNRRHSFNPDSEPGKAFKSLGNRNHVSTRERTQVSDPIPSGTPSPWFLRRQQLMQSSDSNVSPAGSPPLTLIQPVKTVRTPRGPDGTKGFNKPRLPTTAE